MRIPTAVFSESRLGAVYEGSGRCRFEIWAPRVSRAELHLIAPRERLVALNPAPRGYHAAVVEDVWPGARYFYRLGDACERPDPASRSQPDGVHGASEVVSPEFAWNDDKWTGLPLERFIFYELHIGTFTPEGTFESAIARLDELRDLGVTAIELMPVAQFPGGRNWGYDGTYLFAPQNTYGGAQGLKRLVDACHRRGLAAVLDVVYNHLGPEGNYLRDFGPYFTGRYRTPWGAAVNFDGAGSDEVRRYYLENAVYWIEEFHFDALRVDAVHAIYDQSARPFLAELTATVEGAGGRQGRAAFAIAESDLNDPRLVTPPKLGGYGFRAQWSDDFHHAVHCALTGESGGYYADFGSFDHLVKAFRSGFVYTGEYSPARQRSHGAPADAVEGGQLVVFAQNHDQIGNRMLGERLGHLTSFESQKLSAGLVLLSPFLPLLFMGEEYGEDAPFLYFVSHSDPALIEAVRHGRREEFRDFTWAGEPPDAESEDVFWRSKLRPDLRHQGWHKLLYELYAELIRLRQTRPALALLSRKHMEVDACGGGAALCWRRWNGPDEATAVFHFGERTARVELPIPEGRWNKELHSGDRRWGGEHDLPEWLESSGRPVLELAPKAFVLFSR
ncbi:MAG TPA: malto-oligosyltrehalose trehalohydrolase [Bryobacteraceae bacterium]|nr:malto-oligosyltrehalose trehalohydrolase [Bryobacteraceae bacterium]